uniref:SBF2 domain-containing protein n=1 Tax=Mesocestoides corti TaxID=53468 RepID=A0A5K3FH35_MESCO
MLRLTSFFFSFQHHTGRSAFANELRRQTEQIKQVPSSVLRLLTSFCNCTLEVCGKTDDFAPAASILSVAFRIFEQNVDSAGKVVLTYLYEGLRDQALWQSTRFWNAAIFIALREERSNRQVVPNDGAAEDSLNAEAELYDSIAYNQLSSKFAWRMYSLGLSKEACLDFLRKQVDDTSLSKENQRTLRANVLRFYSSEA